MSHHSKYSQAARGNTNGHFWGRMVRLGSLAKYMFVRWPFLKPHTTVLPSATKNNFKELGQAWSISVYSFSKVNQVSLPLSMTGALQRANSVTLVHQVPAVMWTSTQNEVLTAADMSLTTTSHSVTVELGHTVKLGALSITGLLYTWESLEREKPPAGKRS